MRMRCGLSGEIRSALVQFVKLQYYHPFEGIDLGGSLIANPLM
jgi:hypothetical protein